MSTAVEIIYLESLAGQYKKGATKKVKSGYFHNYLAPKGIAMLLSQTDSALLKSLNKQFEKQSSEDKTFAEDVAKTMDNATYELKAKSHDEGKLYGS
eukprot:COSAG01_NODE_1433_length_10317_cov_590.337366_1_plen_96_part_10